jgi:hypothetical protein
MKDTKQDLLINTLGMEIKHLGADLGELKEDFVQICKDNNIAHEKILFKIDEFIERADKRYAPMIAWKAIWWIITGVCGAVLAVIMKSILVNPLP